MPVSSQTIRPYLLLSVFFHLFLTLGQSQVENVPDVLSTPVPGSGHDYIKLLNETVDPSTGSVSLRIDVPTTGSRGLTLPFRFTYDSGGETNYIRRGGWGQNYLQNGGWGYGLPVLRDDVVTLAPNPDPPVNPNAPLCQVHTAFVFTDPSGTRHSLGLSLANQSVCNNVGSSATTYTNASDDFVSAWAPSNAISCFPYCNEVGPFSIQDSAGTVYHFPYITANCTGGYCGLPDYIEDRNGNKINFTQGSNDFPITVTDTAGRPEISIPTFGNSTDSLTIAGEPYAVTWGSTNFTFSLNGTTTGLTSHCPAWTNSENNTFTGSETVVSAIKLPDGQFYHFYYTGDPYGLLSKIEYPDGGYVSYTWGTNPLSDRYSWSYNYVTPSYTQVDPCMAEYDTPAVLHRYVSFDGINIAEQQDFSYSPTVWALDSVGQPHWTSKQTTVTTTDLTKSGHPSYQTVYSYVPYAVPFPPNTPTVTSGVISVTLLPDNVPHESSIVYKDTNGAVLRTIAKTWTSLQLLGHQAVTLEDGSTTSSTSYTFGALGVPVEEDDYDFGGSLLRRTVNSFGGFTTATPLGAHIYDRPCKAVTYDGSGNKVAETDYLYDGGTVVCGTTGSAATAIVSGLPAGTHDETNYAPTSTTVRGNLTKKIQWVNTGAAPTTTYTYDETGQTLSMTDPCGNSTCSDVAGTSHTTTYSYTDRYTNGTPPGNTNAYLTTLTRPTVNGVTTHGYYQYDYTSGQLTVSQDDNDLANGKSTTYAYVDPFSRPTEVNYPDGGQTQYAYSDASPSPSVTTCQLINGTAGATCSPTNPPAGWKTAVATFDGMRHIVETELVSDPDGPTYTTTSYDGTGRPYQVSNPYHTTSDSTYGLTTYYYDALGRTCVVVPPGGTAISASTCPSTAPAGDTFTSYTRRATSVKDEGNGTAPVQRISQVDGLGRLTSVCEVTNSTELGPGGTPAACGQDVAGTGFLTTYQYDSLDNLLTVSQGSMGQRTFAYDSLLRLLCAANPETGTANCPTPDNGTYTAGTTRYAYDANGNVSLRVRPAPNQASVSTTDTTSYSYDALNRLTQKSYSDALTPTVLFGYDQTSVTMGTQQFNVASGIGRLGWECTIAGNSCPTMDAFSYDPVGRPAQLWESLQNVSGANIVLTYNYDRLGDEVSYYIGNSPPGSTGYESTYSGAARLTSFTTSSYVDATNPANLLTGAHYDPFGHLISATLANGLTESWGYDNRGRPKAMAVGTTCSAGNCTGSTAYNYTLGYAPNSNILSGTDRANGQWIYTYDGLNRLLTSNCSANCPDGLSTQGFSYGYDRYGNRWSQTVTAGSGGQSTLSFTGAQNGGVPNNRIDGYSYDAAGNLLNDGTNNYAYDGENRIVSVNGSASTYVYDAEGRRFSKTTAGVTVANIYDRKGNLILYNSPTATGGAPFAELYVAGMHLGTYVLNSAITDTIFYYDHAEWLGTERARTDLAGAVCETIASLPFGDGQRINSTCGDVSPMHFTGKERDSESGLDDFGARYFASTMGRFMTPDPLGGHNEDPQTLNRYAYVRSNPSSLTDPTGLDFYLKCQSADFSGCTQVKIDANNAKSKTWVQADSNGNATIVTSASLKDPNSGNTATVNENGVQITSASGTAEGIFKNGTAAANDIQGSGALNGFSFDIDHSDVGTGNLAGGTFHFNGSPVDAARVLASRGAFNELLDFLDGTAVGFHPFTDQFRFGNGPVSHLSVPQEYLLPPDQYNYAGVMNPKYTTPVTGDYHVDAHRGGGHAEDVINSIYHKIF